MKPSKLEVEHYEKGLKLYGEDRWERCNFGWAQGRGFICSKVYGFGKDVTEVLETTIDRKNNIKHTHSLYK